MIRTITIYLLACTMAGCGVGGGGPAEQAASALTHYPDASFELYVPAQCDATCTFKAAVIGPSNPVATVRYSADGWPLGESGDAAAGYPIERTFDMGGDRVVIAEALSMWGTVLGEARAVVRVAVDGAVYDPSPEPEAASAPEPTPAPAPRPGHTPYFFQYDNRLAPAQTCQNTSIAMVLAQFGWRGVPDDLTAEFGRRRAQSPMGLAAVFNTIADRQRLGVELSPTTTGTLSGLRRELDRGLPVIVHGYMTSFGHVVVVTGYDAGGYYVNDPAGRWSQRFKGGYPGGGGGRGVYYGKAAFEAAIATSDGYSHLPLWYHAVR